MVTAAPQHAPLEPGFVLHTRPYRESSLLVEAFAQASGRIALVARGARRPKSPYRGLLTPFRPLLLAWRGRGDLATLTSAEPEHGAAALSGAALLNGLYLNELLMRVLHRHDSHPELYADYANALRELGSRAPAEPVLRKFELRLMQAIGYGLVLDHDYRSGDLLQPTGRYHYVPEHGPTRERQTPAVEISGLTLAALRAECFDDPTTLREAKRLMRFLLAHHLGDKPLKSRELFRSKRAMD